MNTDSETQRLLDEVVIRGEDNLDNKDWSVIKICTVIAGIVFVFILIGSML